MSVIPKVPKRKRPQARQSDNGPSRERGEAKEEPEGRISPSTISLPQHWQRLMEKYPLCSNYFFGGASGDAKTVGHEWSGSPQSTASFLEGDDSFITMGQ